MLKTHKALAAIVVIVTLGASTTTFARENNTTVSNSDDCYTRVTRQCNERYPGQDMGDASYANCINRGLDWCDVAEPTALSTGAGTVLSPTTRPYQRVPTAVSRTSRFERRP